MKAQSADVRRTIRFSPGLETAVAEVHAAVAAVIAALNSLC